NDGTHPPDIPADLGEAWIETRADDQIGYRSMEHVVGLLDAPELGQHRRRPVCEAPVRLMDDVRVVQGDERDPCALEGPEGVDRVAHDDIGAPFRNNLRNLAGIATENRGKIRDRGQGADDADTSLLDAVIERFHVMQAGDAGDRLEIPQTVS